MAATFALTVGLTNYSYLPLPIMDALFGPESRARRPCEVKAESGKRKADG